MARKKKHEEHENHERWLVSYADFITLLFAFFVVMYAISSVNQGKYRVLSDSLVAAFNDPKKSFEPIQLGEMVKSATNASIEVISKPTLIKVPIVILNNQESEQGKMPGAGFASSPENARDIQKIAEEVAEAMQKLVDMGLVTISVTDLWVEVEIKDSVLFTSGSAQIREEAIAVLTRLAAILADFTNPIRIEGFTDNLPIGTRFYPSNWELSGARAASVVRLFERLHIDSTRLSAVGYGEHRPVAANDTAEGRAKNRRVALVVLADKEVEYLLEERLRHSAAPEEITPVASAGHPLETKTSDAPPPVHAQPVETETAPVKMPVEEVAAGAASTERESIPEQESPVAAPVSAAPVIPAEAVAVASAATRPAAVKATPPVAPGKKPVGRSGGAAPVPKGNARPPNPRPAAAVALPVVPILPPKPLELDLPASKPRLEPGLPLELSGNTTAVGMRPAAVAGQAKPGSR